MSTAKQFFVEVRSMLDELAVLAEKKTTTDQERRRNAYLLAKLATVRQFPGAAIEISETEFREQCKKIKEEGGVTDGLERPVMSPELRAEIEREQDEVRTLAWRTFLRSHQSTLDVEMKKVERRALDVGGLWGRPSGLQYLTDGSAFPGSKGGVLVETKTSDEILYGIAQLNPLLDPKVVGLNRMKTGGLLVVPTLDLTQLTAQIVNDAVQNLPVYSAATVPSAGAVNHAPYAFKATPILAAFEIETDAGADVLLNRVLKPAFKYALENGIGQMLVNGNGISKPQGIVSGIGSSVYTTTTGGGAITADDIMAIYFSLNRAYRNNPKTAWLMSDATYQTIRSTLALSNLPLVLDITADGERLMGKPVHICPSLATANASPIVDGQIIFGDLEYFSVDVVGDIEVVRNLETIYAESGQALYTSILRVDSHVALASASTPAIVLATVKH
jgi:HK97 family phage major capsid protein